MPAQTSMQSLGAAALASVMLVCVLQYFRVAPIGAVLAFAIYFIVWWVCLFAVLPFGVETQSDRGEVIQGTSAGAPTQFRAARIAALTTLATSVAFTCILLALRFKIVPLE